VISDYKELESFIKKENFFKFFKKIPYEFVSLINENIKLTPNLNYKNFKPWYRNIINYPETIYDTRFLTSMGWDIKDVKTFISGKQKQNSQILSIDKKNNPEKYYEKNIKRKEYWMKKGYSEEESKKIISESQKTFSKEICIKKHGEERGIEIFKERQLRWVKSMVSNVNIDEIRKKQNSYINKSFNEMIDRSSFLDETRNIILKGIENNDVNEFIDFVLLNIDVKSLSDLIPFINSKIIQKRYSVTYNTIKDLFYSKVVGVVQTGIYGVPVYHNGVRYKSIKEYKLSLLFETNNVEFVYEKKYPNNKYISDFYLPKYDTYVEYYGMLDKKDYNKLDERQEKYFNKMEEKNLHCINENLNLIYDTDFSKLYEKLQNLIKYENND
jgi:hypothetical protein